MTMTSVAVAPGSLGAPPAMLTPKRYHLQPGLQQNSTSQTSGKNYDTLSKGKKSWSVRLGLSRQSQGSDDSKGWGTISGGSALSRQMLYGDPWLYGTVRSSRGIHDPRAFLAAPPPPGAPVLIVCSCPEFLAGTTRKLGNCRKCGGHRLAGIPLGGTCRITPTSSRSRPSLAGVLRSSVDDPYDVMRRSRLVEPRSRARSISPHRQSNQRDSRSQSVARTNKDRKSSTDTAVSRTEWFDNEIPYDEKTRKSRTTFAGTSNDDWLEETSTDQDCRNTPGRIVRIAKNSRNWQETTSSSRSTELSRRKSDEDWKDATTTNSSNLSSTDSRKSILECNVNPYLLVKKQMRDEDDLSDDLSDNALELDETTSSSLFDPTKVKSIERLPNRSAVAAIGGQRIRVFNEPREIFGDEEILPTAPSVTRIPIPKISPKRPPRRVKESRTTLKSILKKGKPDGKRKNVLFNVNNVIFAPEKPPEIVVNARRNNRNFTNVCKESSDDDREQTIVTEKHVPEKPKFITIPNIRDPKRSAKIHETKIISESKNNSTIEKSKMEQSVVTKKPEVPTRNSSSRKENERKNVDMVVEEMKSLLEIGNNTENFVDQSETRTTEVSTGEEDSLNDEKMGIGKSVEKSVEIVRPEDETELEIEIEELKDRIPEIAVEDEELILKSRDNNRRSCLSRSQSERMAIRREITAANVRYSDTMRLSLRRKITDAIDENIPEICSTRGISVTGPVIRIATPIIRDDTPEPAKMIDGFQDSSARTTEIVEKNEELPSQRRIEISRNQENFRRMRPTSWSPPPGKPKHPSRERTSDPGPFGPRENDDTQIKMADPIRRNSQEVACPDLWNSKNSSVGSSSARIEIINPRPETNVCKITVSPRATPLIHRLQVGGSSQATRGSRRTSILINGDQTSNVDSTSNDNKVTISVGGEDSVCNPTVISVNSESSPKIPSPSENRTLVILENYKSNIVLESPIRDDNSNSTIVGNSSRDDDAMANRTKEESVGRPDKRIAGFGDGSSGFRDKRRSVRITGNANCVVDDDRNGFARINQSKSRLRELDGNSRWSTLSKEALISKLLEDSLRKARENGEILDESSGEAILRILKQSLLKSKEYESSESTIEPETTYSTSPSLNLDADFVSTQLFLEENPYEVIKEPIYEEIADEPPPLPLSPPPTEDYVKERLYYADDYKEAYYKKVNAGQFLRSYMAEDPYKKIDEFKVEDVNADSYLSKSPEEFFKQVSTTGDGNLTSKFELLNFLMDTKDRAVLPVEEDEVVEDDEDDEEDTERDLEALYEQKETSMGDLSSKSSQISNVSDSSEECNIILTSSPEALKTRTVDIERTDSGVGSESSQASSSRGIQRRWRTGNASSGPGSLLGEIPQVISGDTKICEDCEQRLEPLITDSGVVYAPFVCRKCSKKRAERKEIITEIVETEQKYGRDLQIILEEFHRPMLRAGLLTQDQLAAIFLNVEELLEHNLALAEKLKDAVEFSQVSGDEDLVTVDVGKIFLESERMLHVFESYCTRQGGASLLLQNLEKEKELLRIFLKVSQMENTVLRRMNLNSFLMVPVQRVTKYPLLLARLLKATPSVRADVHEARKRLEQAQANIELHLEHMNAEAKDVTSTKLWRRISIIQNGRRSNGEQDMVNIKLRKMAVEVLEWAHEEATFVLEGRLLVAQPTDNNWRRGRTVKLAPVTAMLVTNGKPSTEFVDSNDDSLFPKQIGIKDATLLLVKEKIGRYSLLREPLYLDKCIVCCETDLEDYFEIQELTSKETFIFKAEDGARTKRWCRTLQAHAQSLGAWRRRRGALPNIMICGVARS